MPWHFEESNVLTELVYPWFGSQAKAAAAMGMSGPELSRRRKRKTKGPIVTAEEAVILEEATGGEIDRSELRPDLWPSERWKVPRRRRRKV